jgi:purine-binding chemotaxis protein CheW
MLVPVGSSDKVGASLVNAAAPAMTDHIQFVIFDVDRRQYGIDLSQVERAVRAVDYAPIPQALEGVVGLINYHGEVVPLLSIRMKLGRLERQVHPDDHYLIVRTARRTVALLVDGVRGTVQLPAGSVVPPDSVLPSSEHIAGIVDYHGELILIHNLDRFLSPDDDQLLERAIAEHGGQVPQ